MSKKQPEVLFSEYMVMGKEEKYLEFPFLVVFPLPSFAAYLEFIWSPYVYFISLETWI